VARGHLKMDIGVAFSSSSFFFFFKKKKRIFYYFLVFIFNFSIFIIF
jgi:hypothetical protein